MQNLARLLRRHLLSLAGIGVSLVALVWLAKQINGPDLIAAFRNANLWLLIPAPFLALFSFALRAQRWRLLMRHTPPLRYWPSFRALMIGYLLNNLLPARAGDIARALELGRTERISRTKVLATLVTERVIDLAATLFLLSLVLVLYPQLPSWLKQSGTVIALGTAVVICILAAAHWMGPRFVSLLCTLISRWLPGSVGTRIETMAHSALDGIAGMFRPKQAAGFILLTTLVWAIEVAIAYLVINAAGIALAPGNALFVLLVIAIGTMVPSSPGFVGTYEFFGMSALSIIGISGPSALAAIVLLHVTTLLSSSVIGVISFTLRPHGTRAALTTR
jgi:uncharacterized protein (TIRG00374 family)